MCAGYDYLLNTPLWQLTSEAVGGLEKQHASRVAKRAELAVTDPADMWVRELRQLDQELEAGGIVM